MFHFGLVKFKGGGVIFVTFFTTVELSGFYWFLFGAVTLLFKLSQLATSTVVKYIFVEIVVILDLLFGGKGSSPFEMDIFHGSV